MMHDDLRRRRNLRIADLQEKMPGVDLQKTHHQQRQIDNLLAWNPSLKETSFISITRFSILLVFLKIKYSLLKK